MAQYGERGKSRIVLFLDEDLRTEEGRDMIARIKEGRGRMSSYHEQLQRMGTIKVMTVTTARPNRVYELPKRKIEIEQTFDTFKNTLHADRSYMRDDVFSGGIIVGYISEHIRLGPGDIILTGIPEGVILRKPQKERI